LDDKSDYSVYDHNLPLLPHGEAFFEKTGAAISGSQCAKIMSKGSLPIFRLLSGW
jgi:hypothetical protein